MLGIPIRSYHFVGICGVAMAQIAAWLKNNGREVSGSDQGVYPPMSDFLRSQGIQVQTPYDAANLASADVVVIGNALSRGNPEVEAALEKRIFFLSLPELIHNEILPGKFPAVVAGTHGKTTTTAALATILRQTDLAGGYMIGGLPIGWERGFDVEPGRWFTIEGDEYDSAFFDKRPKFLHYQPQLVLLNSIEFDHADIYSSFEDIVMQFRRLVRLIPRNGCLLVNADYAIHRSLAQDAHCPVVTYGTGTKAQVRSVFIGSKLGKMRFGLLLHSGKEVICETPLWGNHQLINLTGAAAAAECAGVKPQEIVRGISAFGGVQRRLELKFNDGECWLYDDFAHHPTAVRATIAAVRMKHPGLPVFVAFEPRSNTMVRNKFQHELTEALSLADGIAIGKIHRADSIPRKELLDCPRIKDDLRQLGKEVCPQDDVGDIVNWLLKRPPREAVIVAMSNGAFFGLVPQLASRLSESNNDGAKSVMDRTFSGG